MTPEKIHLRTLWTTTWVHDTLEDIMGRLVVSSKQIRWHVSSLCVLQTLEDICSRVSSQLWRTCFFSWCPPNIGGHVSSCGVLHTLEDMCLLVVSSKHWRTCVFSWCPPNIRGHVSAHGVTQSVNWRTQPIFKNWKIL